MALISKHCGRLGVKAVRDAHNKQQEELTSKFVYFNIMGAH